MTGFFIIFMPLSLIVLSVSLYFQWQYVNKYYEPSWDWFWLRYGTGFLAGIAMATAIMFQGLHGIVRILMILGAGLFAALLCGNVAEYRFRSLLPKSGDINDPTEDQD